MHRLHHFDGKIEFASLGNYPAGGLIVKMRYPIFEPIACMPSTEFPKPSYFAYLEKSFRRELRNSKDGVIDYYEINT